MTRWLRSLFWDARPYMTHAEARTRLAKVLADVTPPRVLYAEPMLKEPSRDDARLAYADAEASAELRWQIQEQEQERYELAQRSPKTISFHARGVR